MNKLKQARLNKHFSITQLSEKAGISRATIWNAENGNCTLQEHNQQKIADALEEKKENIFNN